MQQANPSPTKRCHVCGCIRVEMEGAIMNGWCAKEDCPSNRARRATIDYVKNTPEHLIHPNYRPYKNQLWGRG